MGRTAKDVLSYHKGVKKYYKLVDGKFQYFGKVGATKEEALSEYFAWKRDHDNPVRGLMALDDKTIGVFAGGDLGATTPQNAAVVLALGAMREMMGGASVEERTKIYDAAVNTLTRMTEAAPIASSTPERKRAHGLKLSEVLEFWKSVRKPTAGYGRDTKNRFNMLVDCIGDIHFADLTADHMRKFLASMVADELSGNNRAAICGACKVVLNFPLRARARKSEDYDKIAACIPLDLRSITSMLSVDSEEKTTPDSSCQKPFPAKEYKRITKLIDKAGDKRFLGIWHLSVNCGLNLTDLERLTWGESISLEDGTFHLSRLKRGKGERHIPLHRVTVAALREYRKTLTADRAADGQPVFWGVDVYTNRPATPRAIRDEFKAYAVKAKVKGWQFKHLRNVGPNVRVKEGLGVDVTWAFLGHCDKMGEAQKYEYREPSRLLGLVNAIGRAYL